MLPFVPCSTLLWASAVSIEKWGSEVLAVQVFTQFVVSDAQVMPTVSSVVSNLLLFVLMACSFVFELIVVFRPPFDHMRF
jgi:hypothetical protein